MDRPHFDPSFNLGHLINAAALALTLAGMIWWQSGFQTRTELRLDANDEVRRTYVPIVDAMKGSSEVTNDRLFRLGEALKELRDVGRDQIVESSKLRERLVAVETILRTYPNGPAPTTGSTQ